MALSRRRYLALARRSPWLQAENACESSGASADVAAIFVSIPSRSALRWHKAVGSDTEAKREPGRCAIGQWGPVMTAYTTHDYYHYTYDEQDGFRHRAVSMLRVDEMGSIWCGRECCD